MKITFILFSVLMFVSVPLCAAATKYKPSNTQNTQNAVKPETQETSTVKQQTQETATVKPEAKKAPAEKTEQQNSVRPETAPKPDTQTKPAAQVKPAEETKSAATTKPAAEVKPATEVKPADKTSKPKLTQKQVLAGFIAWDKKLKTLKADYKQETFFETTPITSSQGKIYKNGKNLRLDTMENDTILQSAFTDKKEIQIRDGKGALITTLPWEEWYNNQPNKALFDFGNYSRIIKQHDIGFFNEKENGYILSLYPRQINLAEDIPLEIQDIMQPKYQLTFLLDKKDFFPKEIAVSEEGVVTKTTLNNVKKNINF